MILNVLNAGLASLKNVDERRDGAEVGFLSQSEHQMPPLSAVAVPYVFSGQWRRVEGVTGWRCDMLVSAGAWCTALR